MEWARIESSLQISNILHLSIFSPMFLESWSSSLENLATCGSEANCFKQGFLSYTRKVVGQSTSLLRSAHVLAVRPWHTGCLLYLATPSFFLPSLDLMS